MKKLGIVPLVFLTVASCKHADNKFELSGKITGDTTGIVVLIQSGQNRFDADTSHIIGGKFYITGNRELPEAFSLMTEKPNQRKFSPISIFISPGDKIEIELNTENTKKSVMKGSLLNDEFQRYLNDVQTYGNDYFDQLRAEYEKAIGIKDTLAINALEIQMNTFFEEIEKVRTQKAVEYIKSNPKSFIAAYSLDTYRENLDANQIDELLSILDKNLYKSKYIYNVMNADRNQPGIKASDFTLIDTQNKEVNFSAFSKDKVILMEFWASLCGPCRVANPELEKIYQQNREKGFEILGISQDRDKQTLQRSIEIDQITWINLLDLKGEKSVSYLYNCTLLPANILIDRNGMVSARNISLSDLENEILKLLE